MGKNITSLTRGTEGRWRRRSEKQGKIVIRKKTVISMNVAWCTLLVAPWEIFHTLFHTIKTTSICQAHSGSTKHIGVDVFLSCSQAMLFEWNGGHESSCSSFWSASFNWIQSTWSTLGLTRRPSGCAWSSRPLLYFWSEAMEKTHKPHKPQAKPSQTNT